jgi:hypothetical protein
MKINQARQGDLFFKKVNGFPKNSRPNKDKVLAYGEVTGHKHQIISPPMSKLDSYVDEKGDIYVRSSKEEIVIEHDEHGPIVLPPNQWFSISRQREFDAIKEEERLVED